jgi:hypothetical protein
MLLSHYNKKIDESQCKLRKTACFLNKREKIIFLDKSAAFSRIRNRFSLFLIKPGVILVSRQVIHRLCRKADKQLILLGIGDISG